MEEELKMTPMNGSLISLEEKSHLMGMEEKEDKPEGKTFLFTPGGGSGGSQAGKRQV